MNKLFIFVVSVLLVGCFNQPKVKAAPAEDKVVAKQPVVSKDISLLNLKGEVINYQSIMTGEKNILFFWTTWCPYCRKELASLSTDERQAQLKDYNIQYINLGEPKEVVEAYAVKAQLPAGIKDKLLVDPASRLGEKFSVMGIPVYGLCKDADNCQLSNGINEDILKQHFGSKEK